jgi:gamma-tubulin complex component 3
MADLERSIALAYSKASQRLFELFFDKFRLMDHLCTLKDYLMLGKGDFVEILMEQLGCVRFPSPALAALPLPADALPPRAARRSASPPTRSTATTSRRRSRRPCAARRRRPRS